MHLWLAAMKEKNRFFIPFHFLIIIFLHMEPFLSLYPPIHLHVGIPAAPLGP